MVISTMMPLLKPTQFFECRGLHQCHGLQCRRRGISISVCHGLRDLLEGDPVRQGTSGRDYDLESDPGCHRPEEKLAASHKERLQIALNQHGNGDFIECNLY